MDQENHAGRGVAGGRGRKVGELRKMALDRGKSGDLGRWEEEEIENGILGFWGTGALAVEGDVMGGRRRAEIEGEFDRSWGGREARWKNPSDGERQRGGVHKWEVEEIVGNGWVMGGSWRGKQGGDNTRSGGGLRRRRLRQREGYMQVSRNQGKGRRQPRR